MKLYNHIVYASAIILISACTGKKHDDEHEDHNHELEVEIIEHHHDDDEITLHRHEADELGVTTAIVSMCDFCPSIRVSGEIVSSPLSQGMVTARSSGIITLNHNAVDGARVSSGTSLGSISARGMSGGDSNQANEIALKNAKTEYDRIKSLFDDGLATAQEYNSAKSAYDIALNSISGSSVSASATSPISGVVTDVYVTNGQYVEAGQAIAAISTIGDVVIRAEVPSRYSSMLSNASSAIIQSDGKSIAAIRKSTANASGSLRGYFPMYFTIENSSEVLPGGYVEVNIRGGNCRKAIAVPATAIVEKIGQKFVYIREDDDCYVRRPVELGEFDGKNYEIKSGLNVDDEVVVEGATFIRLAETSGAIPEGHSHHH